MNHVRAMQPIYASAQLSKHPSKKILAHPSVVAALLQEIEELSARHLFEDEAIEVFGRKRSLVFHNLRMRYALLWSNASATVLPLN